jgi:hypothetical protein
MKASDAILNPDDLIRMYGIFGAEKVPESGRIKVKANINILYERINELAS